MGTPNLLGFAAIVTLQNFGFSLRMPQVITHEKLLLDCSKEVSAFLSAARLLENKLVCCLLQFAYFNQKAFTGLESFLQRLDPFLAEWPRDVPGDNSATA